MLAPDYQPGPWAEQWNQEIIDDFFDTTVRRKLERPDITRATCIGLAREILGTEEIEPARIQGVCSFTLISRSKGKVVQFRRHALDDDMLSLASSIYGGLTPRLSRYTFEDGNDFPIPTYIANVAPGVHMMCLPQPPFPVDKLCRTVSDLADFFAKPVQVSDQRQSARHPDGYAAPAAKRLDSVLEHPAFKRNATTATMDFVKHVREHVHLIDSLPLVLTHTDVIPMNMFANPDDGSITSVIDWDHACIDIFGKSMWSLYEGFVTYTIDDVTHVQEQRDVIENVFWTRLWESVKPRLTPEVDGPAVRASMAVGAIARYLRFRTLDEIGDNDDVASSFWRTKAFLPLLPRIT
ncbi:hypothetical protein ANO11243_087820 [Dothideomycetidae sp. 11243]|nr:hypothetical protein ANO11243_087820 [fungal sp. No.11243]